MDRRTKRTEKVPHSVTSVQGSSIVSVLGLRRATIVQNLSGSPAGAAGGNWTTSSETRSGAQPQTRYTPSLDPLCADRSGGWERCGLGNTDGAPPPTSSVASIGNPGSVSGRASRTGPLTAILATRSCSLGSRPHGPCGSSMTREMWLGWVPSAECIGWVRVLVRSSRTVKVWCRGRGRRRYRRKCGEERSSSGEKEAGREENGWRRREDRHSRGQERSEGGQERADSRVGRSIR